MNALYEMMFFGKRFGGAMYHTMAQTETPVGATCQHCGETIAAGDDGLFYSTGPVAHHECFMRAVTGSVEHQMRLCYCFDRAADSDEQARRSYVVAGDAIVCKRCGTTSHNPNDVANLYCAACHRFHDGPLTHREDARGARAYFEKNASKQR